MVSRQTLLRASPALAPGAASAGGPAAARAAQHRSTHLALRVAPPVLSVTAAPSSGRFGACAGRSSSATVLGIPNGACTSGKVRITNGSAPAMVTVNGADVVPAGGGTSWALCGSGDRLAPACTGSSGKPGADQYRLQAISRAGTAAESLSNAQQCDLAFAATGTSCSAARGATATETVALTGPQRTTNTATSYGTTVAYTVVAP